MQDQLFPEPLGDMDSVLDQVPLPDFKERFSLLDVI